MLGLSLNGHNFYVNNEKLNILLVLSIFIIITFYPQVFFYVQTSLVCREVKNFFIIFLGFLAGFILITK